MPPGDVVDTVRHAVVLTLVVGAPVLLTGLTVGLVVSVLQAATQVQEYTLSFVPKIAAMLVALILFGPWMLDRLVAFSRSMFGFLP